MKSTVDGPADTRPAPGPKQPIKELLYSAPGKQGILLGPTHAACVAARTWVRDRAWVSIADSHSREGISGTRQSVEVSGRAARVAWELMDNALKYSRSGMADGSLLVELSRTRFLLKVAVTDGGPLLTERPSLPREHERGGGGLNRVGDLSVYWDWDGRGTAGSPVCVYAQIELP